ncbi:MAG TPA: hypothetical protein VH592_00765 [Gemmataceae bacterium]|jgi:hypothetical protein
MALSVIDPVGSAIERARHVCFGPFDLGKWFVIGFCAFLAAFAEGGTNAPFNFNFNTGGGPGRGGPGGKSFGQVLHEGTDWFLDHLIIFLVIGLIVLIFAFALGTVLLWVGSRGRFMFIDNIVRNRGAVSAPWSEYREEGNSVFWFHLLFGLAGFVVTFAILGGAFYLALPDIRAEKFGSAATGALALLIGGLLVAALVSGVITLFLNDFVVPIMYLRRIGVLGAWREFGASMLADHVGTFVLYFLFKILLAIIVGFLTLTLMCCTFCIGFIPYLGTHVLLLPIHVFSRSYSLYFIEQFGSEWQVFRARDVVTAELADEESDWSDWRFRPGNENIRPTDDPDLPPDDRFRPG